MIRFQMRWLVVGTVALVSLPIAAQDPKAEVAAAIDKNRARAERTALQIWDFAEVGYKETKSSALLQQQLRDAGFAVEAGVAGMPTAFVASYGSGQPVIGILAEFDALPGITQTVKPERDPAAGKDAGHACGHHLFGTASTFAAMAVNKGMMVAAKTLAMTAVDLMTNPKMVADATAAYRKQIPPGWTYRSLVGDRQPPLDYRDK